MAIILSFSTDSPRGPVVLTADLSGLESYQMSKEIGIFFDAVLSLRCKVHDLEQQQEEIREKIAASSALYAEHPAEQEDIMVIS